VIEKKLNSPTILAIIIASRNFFNLSVCSCIVGRSLCLPVTNRYLRWQAIVNCQPEQMLNLITEVEDSQQLVVGNVAA
jgi:hypothetical protein